MLVDTNPEGIWCLFFTKWNALDIVISAGNDRYWDLSSKAGPQEVSRSRMPNLKAAKGGVFYLEKKDSTNINKLG